MFPYLTNTNHKNYRQSAYYLIWLKPRAFHILKYLLEWILYMTMKFQFMCISYTTNTLSTKVILKTFFTILHKKQNFTGWNFSLTDTQTSRRWSTSDEGCSTCLSQAANACQPCPHIHCQAGGRYSQACPQICAQMGSCWTSWQPSDTCSSVWPSWNQTEQALQEEKKNRTVCFPS